MGNTQTTVKKPQPQEHASFSDKARYRHYLDGLKNLGFGKGETGAKIFAAAACRVSAIEGLGEQVITNENIADIDEAFFFNVCRLIDDPQIRISLDNKKHLAEVLAQNLSEQQLLTLLIQLIEVTTINPETLSTFLQDEGSLFCCILTAISGPLVEQFFSKIALSELKEFEKGAQLEIANNAPLKAELSEKHYERTFTEDMKLKEDLIKKEIPAVLSTIIKNLVNNTDKLPNFIGHVYKILKKELAKKTERFQEKESMALKSTVEKEEESKETKEEEKGTEEKSTVNYDEEIKIRMLSLFFDRLLIAWIHQYMNTYYGATKEAEGLKGMINLYIISSLVLIANIDELPKEMPQELQSCVAENRKAVQDKFYQRLTELEWQELDAEQPLIMPLEKHDKEEESVGASDDMAKEILFRLHHQLTAAFIQLNNQLAILNQKQDIDKKVTIEIENFIQQTLTTYLGTLQTVIPRTDATFSDYAIFLRGTIKNAKSNLDYFIQQIEPMLGSKDEQDKGGGLDEIKNMQKQLETLKGVVEELEKSHKAIFKLVVSVAKTKMATFGSPMPHPKQEEEQEKKRLSAELK